MTAGATETLERFHYAIVRVVPDPVKDEAVNIGVVVTPAEGTSGRLRVHLSTHVRGRIRAMHPGHNFAALQWALRDLEAALGIDSRVRPGEHESRPASAALLEDVARRLGNQLQLSAVRRYVAQDLDRATEELFERFVTWRPPRPKQATRLTHGQLRDQILHVVATWQSPTLHVQDGGVLHGAKATHPADIMISNGHPRAAIFAVPTSRADDDSLPYLYRDRIPTIAQDAPRDFLIYAVLPDMSRQRDEHERLFAEETRRLLSEVPRLTTVEMRDLDQVRPQVERLLVEA